MFLSFLIISINEHLPLIKFVQSLDLESLILVNPTHLFSLSQITKIVDVICKPSKMVIFCNLRLILFYLSLL